MALIDRFIEFFEADDGRLSMTRLLCFLSFWPASYLLMTNGDESMLGWYLGAFVSGYVGGKFADKKSVVINQTGDGDANLVKNSNQ